MSKKKKAEIIIEQLNLFTIDTDTSLHINISGFDHEKRDSLRRQQQARDEWRRMYGPEWERGCRGGQSWV